VEDSAVEISVIGRHVKVSEEVKEYATRKVAKIEKFYDRIQHVDVVLDHEGDQYTVDMIVNVAGRDNFIAHERGEDTFALIDLIIDKLKRQLRRHKERLRNRKHPTE